MAVELCGRLVQELCVLCYTIHQLVAGVTRAWHAVALGSFCRWFSATKADATVFHNKPRALHPKKSYTAPAHHPQVFSVANSGILREFAWSTCYPAKP